MAAESRPDLVEMNWDPITRIVGSLGIYTKIDFANREVAECYSTSSIFRGYSVFMKGKDPRDAHFIQRRGTLAFDEHGTPGPYEDAVQNTPIFEENGPEEFKGIDIMRTVRSFDPCLPCGVHMYLGKGKELKTMHSPMFGVQRQ